MLDSRNKKILVSILVAFFLVLGYNIYSVSQVPDDRKVAVIVLDGADFEILDKLKEEGEIQNIQQMESEGISTVYQTPESFSPQTWTKMGTGMSTENISIERKWTYEDEEGNERRLDSNAVENRRFWSYLNEDNIETGLYHWVMTWPVEPVKGFMVSGFLSANLDEMTYPDNLEVSDDEIRSSLVLFNTFDTAQALTEEYYGMEVMVYGFQISDRLQHGFWKFLDDEDSENQEFRELMYEPYREVDEMIGELRPEYTVILVSDHGFDRAWADTYQADLNDLLEQIGLTSYEVNEEGMARNQVFHDDAVLAHRPHENEILNQTHYKVNFEFLNSDPEVDVISRLEELKYSDGKPLLTDFEYQDGNLEAVMYLNQDEMSDQYLDERHMRLSYARGDLPILEQDVKLEYEGQNVSSSLGPVQTGDHPPGTNGVIYAVGEGIVSEGRMNADIKAEDLAPLILYLKGSPIPEDMDGEIPKEIFEPGYLRYNSPEYEDRAVKRDEKAFEVERESSQDERVSERLEDLGYLR